LRIVEGGPKGNFSTTLTCDDKCHGDLLALTREQRVGRATVNSLTVVVAASFPLRQGGTEKTTDGN
jgi:hypothetical protein